MRNSRSFTPQWKDQDESTQLYRFKDCKEALDLIANQHLYTDEEILNFLCAGCDDADLPKQNNETARREEEYCKKAHPHYDSVENKLLRKLFHQRRQEIRLLAEKLDDGGATIDQDGRLVPVTQPPQPPRANLPPPPPQPGLQNDNNNNNIGPLLAEIDINNNPILPEQQLEEFFERERQVAAATIAREVQRLRLEGVPEEDFEVILIDPRGDGLGPPPPPGAPPAMNRGTLRRIFIVLTAILSAFACVVIHTLPLLSDTEPVDPRIDSLLFDLLKVRTLTTHLGQCLDLSNRTATKPNTYSLYDWKWWQQKWTNLLQQEQDDISDCSDGVLHFPPVEGFGKYGSGGEVDDYNFGVDVFWFMPCVPHRFRNHDSQCNLNMSTNSKQECLVETNDKYNPSHRRQCFRGIHDYHFDSGDISEAIRMGHYLIEKGGDHFDINYDISPLNRRLPGVLQRLKDLLNERYQQDIGSLRPVAFRVLTTCPMDAHGVRAKYPSTLNHTNYRNWVERCKEHNNRAQYPWPFAVPPKRETCTLMADLQADSRFCILTSIYLADGAGLDYRGGSTLFVDHHPSNENPKLRIQRGISIDGQQGRVVVSTGGIENLRCRFPTRSGRQIQLQIWWDCGS
jgi:hypothetical protein